MTQQNQETVTKQKNPLRIKQGRKLVEYNRRKKEELKRLNEQITKQDSIAEYKPRTNSNNYVYAGGLSVFGLAIGGYLLHSKFKKPERKEAGAIQKDLQLYNVDIASYYTDKYALWLDFRTIDDNRLHSSGRRLENTSEGIRLQITKKAESAGKLSCYLYTFQDAQINISDDQFLNVLY